MIVNSFSISIIPGVRKGAAAAGTHSKSDILHSVAIENKKVLNSSWFGMKTAGNPKAPAKKMMNAQSYHNNKKGYRKGCKI